MLEEKKHPGGMITLHSPLLANLGVPHAFSTRHGHDGMPMDLGQASIYQQDNADGRQIKRNLNKIIQNIGGPKRTPIIVRQVHGKGVYQTPHYLPEAFNMEADAIMTDHPNAMAVIRVADCVPILISDEDGKRVAAVHAGWRGVVADIIGETIYKMAYSYGIDARNLTAAIGPCISVKHFEVGEEVVDAFKEADLATTIEREGYEKPHINLTLSVKTQLERAGLQTSNIDTCDDCTFANADLFYSYRREAKLSGRLGALIGPRNS